jgi:phosphoribosylglycinamide formyltransferase-1
MTNSADGKRTAGPPDGWDVRRRGDEKLRVAVLASGSGSNAESIMAACESGAIPAEVVALLCNNPGAYCLERAGNHNVPALTVNHRDFKSRGSHEAEILAKLHPYRPHVAVLAGYMRMVTGVLLNAFRNPDTGLFGVINIHPADTRAYQGTHGYEFAMGMLPKFPKRLDQTWITVHFVDEGMDTGPIIRQRPVPMTADDTIDTLRERGLKVEHKLYPEVIGLVAQNKVRLDGDKVVIDE